ncbi:MAG: serine protease [Flavobacteriales bacterium]|nr:serine protease [Flavobacteriales bacterium]
MTHPPRPSPHLISVLRIPHCAIALLLGSAAFAQQGEIVFNAVAPSTVLIQTDLGVGSGFFLMQNFIVTNYHVIKGCRKVSFTPFGSDKRYDSDGVTLWDEAADLALISTGGFKGKQITMAPNAVNIGQTVYALGNAEGIGLSISNGIISRWHLLVNKRWIQHTAPISPGSSGGPLVNADGQLIGVTVAQYSEGQNINFAIPLEALWALLNVGSDRIVPYSELTSAPSHNGGISTGTPTVVTNRDHRDFVRKAVDSWQNCYTMALTRTKGIFAMSENAMAYKGISVAVDSVLLKLAGDKRHVDDVILSESGAAVILYDGIGCTTQRVDKELLDQLSEILSHKTPIWSVAFNDNGAWAIVTEEGIYSSSSEIQGFIVTQEPDYGKLLSVTMTNNAVIACYEGGFTYVGEVPKRLLDAITESDMYVRTIKLSEDGSYFFGDNFGHYRYFF